MGKEWFPSLEEYNPGITKEQWIEFVQDKNLFNENALITFACIQKAKVATCADMAEEFGRSFNFYNTNNWRTGERIYKKLNCTLSERDEGGNRFWSVCCLGRESNKGRFEFKIRPELQEAFEETGILEGIEVMEEKDLIRFKRLLEYFVTHLEWCENQDENFSGYEKFIKPIKEKFKSTGKGENGNGIQIQINKWDCYKGRRIGITIYNSHGRGYQQRNCYLHWMETWYNIHANWENKHITSLYLSKEPKADAKKELEKTIEELGLFTENITDDFKNFFNEYMKYGIGDSQMTDYEKKLDEIKNNLLANKNVILTGAPGTGKTFMAKTVAARIILEREINDFDKDLTEEEKKQVESQTDFAQFHPSYDYTDFVEGLRPKQVDGSDQIGFERKDGVFKAFCERALLSQTINNKDFLENLNKNPKIWKVSLCRTGENEIRKDCLENNYIRIGWSEYGDIENFDDFENFSNGGKSILRSYQNEMQIGDIVLSCFSAKEIDAIGIITGDYEYKREENEYPRYRNVKWIVKNIRENIIELNNGKSLTLSTIYKLSISLTDIKFIIEKYITGKSEEKEPTPFVFIIDEINRGEVAKIFGELFYCVDPGYRGEKGRISTQYQNLVTSGEFQKGFFIPENVYIIGTMNDIDRSVESMDFAFRRRFSWIEVKASDTVDMLDPKYDDNGELIAGLEKDLAEEAKLRMENLNAAISKIDELNDAYHIGASYFLKLKNYGGDFGKLWDYHLKGILQEYLRGNPNAKEELEKLKAAYDKAEELKA